MMARLNLLLLLMLLVTALGVVSNNHRARKHVTAFERERSHMQALNIEQDQLQLEQSTWSRHERIEEIARQRLGMQPPGPGQIIIAKP